MSDLKAKRRRQPSTPAWLDEWQLSCVGDFRFGATPVIGSLPH